MNENHTNQQGLTLEEIAVHKQALKIAIAEQQKNVNEAYRQVVAPMMYLFKLIEQREKINQKIKIWLIFLCLKTIFNLQNNVKRAIL